MLFQQLPAWAITVVLAISCAVKYVTVSRFIDTQWYQRKILSDSWLWALALMGLLNGLISFAIFNHFVDWPLNVLIASMDSGFYIAAALFQKQTRLSSYPSIVSREHAVLLRLLHVMVYVIFIWIVLK